MENEELVGLIEDEMYVISYMTEKWSREISEEKEPVPKKVTSKPEKPKTNGKKEKTTAQP